MDENLIKDIDNAITDNLGSGVTYVNILMFTMESEDMLTTAAFGQGVDKNLADITETIAKLYQECLVNESLLEKLKSLLNGLLNEKEPVSMSIH